VKTTLVSTALLTLCVVSCSLSADVTDRDTVKRSLRFGSAGGTHRILVDNVNGSIDVVGYDGDVVELVAYRRVHAESESRMQAANEEVTLDIREESDRILVYVDAPWRKQDGSVNYRGWDYHGYEVDYDFELRVPVKTDFILKTVNDGDIDVRNMTGAFEVRNVNGDVDMRGVAGSGRVSTVNGDVVVTFTKNPAEESSFKTVNGKVDVEFPEPLSASIRLKTMNGDVYTDFPVKQVPQQVATIEKRNGRKIYRSGDSFVVEAGSGGPELSFNTLNGDIYLSLKEENK
jgi:opacity protein-like surface antigen